MSKKNNARPNKKGIPTSNPNEVLEREVSVPDHTVVEAEEANKPIPSYSFFSRVLSIPLIRDAQYYANQNSISRFAITKAESTIKMAASIASPYAEKYKHHLLKADQMGCQSLDLVENKFPVVRQDAAEIYTSVVQAPTELVNRYLPPKKDESSRNVEDNRNVLSIVKERLAHRLQSIPHSKADVARLAETLQETFHSIQIANTRLNDFIVSLKGGYTSTQNKANQRINELTIDLIKRLDSAAAYVKEHHVISNLPSSLHIVVDPLVTFASNEYEIVRTQVLKDDLAPLQKATNIMHLTQEYVLPLIQNSIQQVRQYSLYSNNSKGNKEASSGLVSASA
ncbi:hypothetical protein INT47_005171 [Mucor saturninus]|uniref:Uncharacterized protein n=1 Tax=Mucor saturninus TaxID=64648 RepID=A0A8H7QVS1_9FUNG|nr:hypothetical protein INT47_005171 [Mucor saturninus]